MRHHLTRALPCAEVQIVFSLDFVSFSICVCRGAEEKETQTQMLWEHISGIHQTCGEVDAKQ